MWLDRTEACRTGIDKCAETHVYCIHTYDTAYVNDIHYIWLKNKYIHVEISGCVKPHCLKTRAANIGKTNQDNNIHIYIYTYNMIAWPYNLVHLENMKILCMYHICIYIYIIN